MLLSLNSAPILQRFSKKDVSQYKVSRTGILYDAEIMDKVQLEYISPRDNRFTKWKIEQQKIAQIFRLGEGKYYALMNKELKEHGKSEKYIEYEHRVSEFRRLNERLNKCSDTLSYGLPVNDDDNSQPKFLGRHNCSMPRICPLCAWRDRLKNAYALDKTIEKIDKELKDKKQCKKVLFATFTLPNIKVYGDENKSDNITETVGILKKAFYSFKMRGSHKGTKCHTEISKLINFEVEDYYTAFEISFTTVTSEFGEVHVEIHPHLHCLILAPGDYHENNLGLYHPPNKHEAVFSNLKYHPNISWVEIWSRAIEAEFKKNGRKYTHNFAMCDVQELGYLGDELEAKIKDSFWNTIGADLWYYPKNPNKQKVSIFSSKYWDNKEKYEGIPYSENDRFSYCNSMIKEYKETLSDDDFTSELIETIRESTIELFDQETAILFQGRELEDTEIIECTQKDKYIYENRKVNKKGIWEVIKYVTKPDFVGQRDEKKFNKKNGSLANKKPYIDSENTRLDVASIYWQIIQGLYQIKRYSTAGRIREKLREFKHELKDSELQGYEQGKYTQEMSTNTSEIKKIDIVWDVYNKRYYLASKDRNKYEKMAVVQRGIEISTGNKVIDFDSPIAFSEDSFLSDREIEATKAKIKQKNRTKVLPAEEEDLMEKLVELLQSGSG